MPKFSDTWYAQWQQAQTLSDEDAEDHAERQAAGNQARLRGENFQNMLDAQHLVYLNAGRSALIHRQTPPMRPTVKHGELLFRAVGKGPCDYVFVTPAGIYGVFDAKTSQSEKVFTWPEKSQHQLDHLWRVHRDTNGVAPALAVVWWRAHDRCKAHPVYSIDGRTVRYCDGDDADGFDWLSAVEDRWRLREKGGSYAARPEQCGQPGRL